MSLTHGVMANAHAAATPSEGHDDPSNGDATLGASQTGAEKGLVDVTMHDTAAISEKTRVVNARNEGSELLRSASSKKWKHYKERMDRLDAAVRHAMTIPNSEAEDASHAQTPLVQGRAITLGLEGEQNLKIPWDACRTWQHIEAFLRKWYSEDEDVLKAITERNFTISDAFNGTIHPGQWESIMSPQGYIKFSLEVPPGVSIPSQVSLTDAQSVSETLYENRIQYEVRYFQRQGIHGRSEFISTGVYDEPVELQLSEEYKSLPVLEESRKVESPPTLGLPRINRMRKGSSRLPKLHQGDTVSDPVLKIHSPYLLNILKAVIECSAEPPAGDNQGLDAGTFAYPFMDLYLHLENLLEYKLGKNDLRLQHSEEFNRYADEHIDLLHMYLASQKEIQYEEAKARWDGDLPLTTFGTFWLLMKPGTDVYVRESDGSLNRFVLDRLTGGTYKDFQGKKVTVKYTAQVWNLVLDDKAIHQNPRIVHVPVFDDEREIVDLPVFPVRFQDEHDNGTTHQVLIDRGRKYFMYAHKPSFLQYDGQGLKPGSRVYKRARVVVEHASRPWVDGSLWGSGLDHYMPEARLIGSVAVPRRSTFSPTGSHAQQPPATQMHSLALSSPPQAALPLGQTTPGGSMRIARCECKNCQAHGDSQKTYHRLKFSEYREIDPKVESDLTDHQYSILPSHMFAFVLNDRAYDLLDVEKLQEPSMSETAIEKLVIRAGNKEVIKAIARTYTENYTLFSADFIYGKGEGQIILLHGPPGTGKTLTAESVAEFTKRPLLNITAADLGHEPEALEKRLLRYFRRANDWDAIMLLDEADVYLEERSSSDLKRNSVVSVFLRALDYFQGILFLTTNRVGQFDEAFMSRIHLSLGYDKLNDDARAQIWENLFQKLREDYENNNGPEIRYDYYAKEYVTKNAEVNALQWNGREIRNAFQTAVALAVYDAKHRGKGPVPKVTETHLKQVVSMSSAFRKYITATHNDQDHSTRAFQRGNRDDGSLTSPKK